MADTPAPLLVLQRDHLTVHVHADRAAMARAAAAAFAAGMRAKGRPLRLVFAAAPSQAEFLAELVRAPDLPWAAAAAWHLDEYLDLPAAAPQRFASWLDQHLFSQVPLAAVHRLDSTAADPRAECARYAASLGLGTLDLAAVGIGTNGHLAFNDPPVADFADPATVKVVELDARCRQQQVDDQCFARLADVPRLAMTLTIPAILAARRIIAVVPAAAKAQAVRDALFGPICTACPASILRTHPQAELHLDREAAALLPAST